MAQPEADQRAGGMVRTRLYRDGVLEAEDFDPALVSDFLQEDGTIVWLDLPCPTAGDMAMLAEEFRLHPLAIEDASSPHQRPKAERYEHHLFVVMYAVWLEGPDLQRAEVDAFIGERFIITVRKDERWDIGRVVARWDSSQDLMSHGAGTLLHGLLDQVADEYFEVADALEDSIEELEERVLDPKRDGGVQEVLFDLRKCLVGLARYTLPLHDVVSVLKRRELVSFPEDMVPYFQDIQDHLMRVASSVDAMQQLLSSALQIHLSVVSNRLNEIMKKVTSWAAIIGVATLIVGVYGMNFRLLPRESTIFGFWFALAAMGASAVGLYAWFRSKDWL